MRRTLILGALVAALAAPSLANPTPPYHPPSEAIPFSGPLLDGGRFDLETYLGKTPIVLNFWASWCRPCHREAEVLEAYFREYAGRVAFVSVNVQDPSSSARAFVERYGITFPVVQDGGADVAWTYRVTGLPTTFFIDVQGRVVYIHQGPLYPQQLERYLERLLAPPAPEEAP
ncbi:TlpA disulfide reductase family protein [Oceanithermus sp.]|uniref:TlpA family protein disulfide reductase n=1 Tax=Oceanithermus sp. TaxID=2268145 RepID=UPI0025D0EDC7|nr:TlpA disulfide reductase family protein [Oceanithermus sp.]